MPVPVGEAELVDQRVREGRDERGHGLIGPVAGVRPVGRKAPGTGRRSEAVVLIVGVAEEEAVAVARQPVQSRAGLGAVEGAREDPAQVRESRRCRLDAHDAVLVVVLEAGEEEQPIPSDRAAHGEAYLPAGEEGIRIGRIALESRIGRQVVVAKEEEPAAVIPVASGARDDVDGARIRQPRRQVEVGARELELLDDLLGEVLRNASVQGVVDRPAVHRHPRRVGRPTEDGDIELAAEEPGRRSGRDSRLEHGELEKLSPVERKVLDLEARHDAVDAVLLKAHLGSGAGGLHGLLQDTH